MKKTVSLDGMSRRAFIGKVVATVGAVALGNSSASFASTSLLKRKGSAGADDEEILDVAIVGAGISGIYCGWRLVTADPSRLQILGRPAGSRHGLSVKVFEGSRRIGGRLLSARPSGMSVVCELGGMRFVSAQRRVVGLINELKLPQHPLYTFDPKNHAFIRGRHLRISDLNNPSLLPYNLTPAERECVQRHGPDLLVKWGISRLLPGVANLHGQELYNYLQAAQVDGTPLYQHGFWNLLARTLSSEACMLARATIGFDGISWNTNAVDLILQYFFHTPDVTYHVLDNGYDALPWTLQQNFESAGGKIVEGVWLSGFKPVHLRDGSAGLQLRFRGPCPPVTARALILAIPKRSLELILPDCPAFSSDSSGRFQELLNSVAPLPLSKIVVCYSRRWWRDSGVCRGQSVTDLPVRQCWYWTDSQQADCGSDDRNAIIMAYNDAGNVDFWGGFRPPRPANPELRLGCKPWRGEEKFDSRLRENWTSNSAPPEMVVELHRQLQDIHNLRSAPEPTEAAYVDWSYDPFGAGSHLWNRGIKSWSVVEQMTQPVPDLPCYICGEAYSTAQGWVEGALETAELVLQKRLGLPAPAWSSA